MFCMCKVVIWSFFWNVQPETLGEMIQIDFDFDVVHVVQMSWKHQPDFVIILSISSK